MPTHAVGPYEPWYKDGEHLCKPGERMPEYLGPQGFSNFACPEDINAVKGTVLGPSWSPERKWSNVVCTILRTKLLQRFNERELRTRVECGFVASDRAKYRREEANLALVTCQLIVPAPGDAEGMQWLSECTREKIKVMKLLRDQAQEVALRELAIRAFAALDFNTKTNYINNPCPRIRWFYLFPDNSAPYDLPLWWYDGQPFAHVSEHPGHRSWFVPVEAENTFLAYDWKEEASIMATMALGGGYSSREQQLDASSSLGRKEQSWQPIIAA